MTLRAAGALALLLAPCVARAHNLEGLGAGIGGGVVGLVAGVWMATRQSTGLGRRLLACMLWGPLGVLVGSVVGVGLSQAVTASRNASFAQAEQRYRDSALGPIACKEPAAALRTYLDSEAGRAESPPVLGRALQQCGLGRTAESMEVFRQLAPRMAQAPEVADEADDWPYPATYCQLLRTIHGAQRADLVRELLSLGLALNCISHAAPVWWVGLGSPTEGTPEWLQSLRNAPGIDFSARHAESGESALDRAVQCHDARVVRLVMEAGRFDPQRASGPRAEYAPVVWWTLRRFGSSAPQCPSVTAPTADTAAVDAAMGGLTAAHINQAQSGNGQTLLWRLPRDDRAAAALLTHLLEHGADAQRRDHFDKSFLHDRDTGPLLLAALSRLPASLIQQMAGAPLPLVDNARQRGNVALVEFLCARGAQGC